MFVDSAVNLHRCLSSSIWFLLTQWLPRCKSGHINIHYMPPNKVSRAWFSQQVVWLPGPSDNRLPHAVWKIPPFSGEIYEGSSVPLSSQQPLWSHSPLVDCLPNGHWQMGLKIASLAPLPQKPTIVVQNAAAFLSPNFALLISSFLKFLFKLHLHISFGVFSFPHFFYYLHLMFTRASHNRKFTLQQTLHYTFVGSHWFPFMRLNVWFMT